ncbi:MAG TPA: glycosyltransferase [Flavobacterium sp.]|nr:glycosyltransferase [Flavobacterium sp.]
MQIYKLIRELASSKKYFDLCIMNPRILIIGLVFPEPTSSAAGWRMLQLIEQLQQWSTDVHFASAASKSESSFPLETLGVKEHHIILNDASFNDFVADLQPQVVMYDRFMAEEQFGWRVKQLFPAILTILDTEDLHFLRRARTASFKNNTPLDLDTPDCYRELSSIYRSDLSIIISKVEYDLLKDHFKIPEKQLLYLPFIENEITEDFFDFQSRKNLMFIGNFIHEPNYQTVLRLKKIWTSLRKKLPNVELHIYGAYPPQKVLQLHNEKEGFIIKGKAENVDVIMKEYRVLAAPIPFGAGLKGKFIDGFKNGLPNVTTKIGAEGMNVEAWGGLIAESDEDFINKVVQLYSDENLWKQLQENGKRMINEQFSKVRWDGILVNRLQNILSNITNHRSDLFIQKIMWQNQFQATKYMSLWIESKNNKSEN